MRSLFTRTTKSAAAVCGRCARACDDTCRRAALRSRVVLQQIWRGPA